MNVHIQNAESDPLKRCFASLGAVLAADSSVESQLDSVLAALDLERVSLRLQAGIDSLPSEIVKFSAAGGPELAQVELPLGVAGELGSLNFAAARDGFPLDSESAVLEVAAIKVANALFGVILAEQDHRRSEQAAQYKEDLLHQLCDSIAAEVTLSTPDGDIVFANKTCLEHTGKPFGVHYDWATGDQLHPEDLPRVKEAWTQAVATGGNYEVDVRSRCYGVYRWMHSHGFPIRDEQGRIQHWCTLHLDIHDRKVAEESLRASELMLKSMVDSIAAPLGFFKPTGELEVVNRQVEDYFGKPFDEFSNWENIVHPDDLNASRAAWNRSIETGEPYQHEARIRRADGTYRWNDHRGYPMRNEEGRIIRWCVLQTDIHDRRRAEDGMAESERRLETIINTIPAMAWTANPDGSCDFFNRHHLRYVDRELKDMQGFGFVSTFHPDDIERLMGAWQAMLDSGRGGEVEGRICRRDGEYRWCLFITNPQHDAEGRVVKWFGINIDIEDRKRAQDQVRESELNFRRQTETIPQMLWSATADGAIDYCNERLLEYSALTAETVMNGGWVNLLHPDDRAPTSKIWLHCTATGQPYTVEVRQFHAASQTHRWVLTTALPLRDAEGRILKWYGSCVDIHDRKLADQALAASERELNQIVSVIPGLVWSSRPDGSATFVNQLYVDYVGLPAEKLLDWGYAGVVHPDDLEQLTVQWQRILASRRPGELEARIRRFDGEYRWFLFRGSPAFDEAGNVVKWHGVNIDIEDRKRAEEALRASELNLRRQTETIPQMLWSALPDGSFDYCNARFLDYTGSAAKGVMGDGWRHAIHPDDQESTARDWQHAVMTGEPYRVEVRKFCAAAAEYHWCLTTALPLRDEDGRIIKWHGSSVDIHDRKLAEQALKESERRLDQIINTIPGMAWSANPDGMCDFFNRYHLDYVGLPVEEMRGTGFVKTFHPDDLPQLMGPWQEMLASGRGGEVEGRIRGRDGEYRRFLFRTNPLFDADGKLVKWFGVNFDIEDRKRAEDKLRESELNLRQLTETIPQMLWSTDPEGRVEYSNTRLQEFMGITAEEFAGHSWADCLHPDDRESTARLWAHCVATATPYRTEARFCYGGKGTYRWCLTTGLPLRDESGRIIKWHGACVDLHDWKTAQDELRETQAELAHVTRVMIMGHLTASIAHELNQPLSGIMTNAGTGLRMLTAEPPNVDGARETARRTIRDAKRASEVISRLRALFAKRPTASEIVDLNTAVEEVIALSSNELQRNGVTYRVNLKDNLPYAMGDRIQLQQVILNFILNGAEAMETVDDRARELFITTSVDTAGYVRVSVRDAGVGFAPELAEKIFSPFYTTKSSGMGIGLSVSRTIVENHQGRLWAEANDGPGATFSFSLPSTLAAVQAGKA